MIGTKIGQYRVLRLLGEGAMGRVLLVEHALIKTRYALKILHDQMSKSDMITQRFLNEARAAGAIGHRNVVEITHVDQVEGGGPWYVVMKYLEGQTLAAFLTSQNGPLEQRVIVHILGEALNGLQAAHDHQIVHRDLKPDNLYLTAVKDDPYRAIILDFGVAQLGHDPGIVTRSGTVIGTPQYMAPEQHRGAAIDRRADIWAMGAIAYEMATGRLPYLADGSDRGSLTAQEIFHRMMTCPVVDPRYYNPLITEAFAGATLIALHPDPSRRMHSARTLARMLAEGTPGTAHGPSGIELLKRYADELLDNDVAETVRPSKSSLHGPGLVDTAPIAAGQHGSATRPVPDTMQMPVSSVQLSTLGATASQSFSPPQHRQRRRPWFVVGIGLGTAMLTGIATTAVVVILREPPNTIARDQAKVVAADATIANLAGHHDVIATDAAITDAAQTTEVAMVDADAGGVRTRGAADVGPIDASVAPPRPPIRGGGEDAGARSKEVRAEPGATGELKVVVVPWAEVGLDGRALGQTPVRVRVTAGKHRVRLKNDATEKTFTITVTASKLTLIEESL